MCIENKLFMILLVVLVESHNAVTECSTACIHANTPVYINVFLSETKVDIIFLSIPL